jgi:hypothetical protein
MKAKTLCSIFVAVVMFSMAPLELSAKTLGMVADNETDSVTVFEFDADDDTHAVLGTVAIDPGDPFLSAIGDVLITGDLKRGFVTNRNGQVFVIDLTTSPPSLAGGTNPIPISSFGGDLSISPDGKFLVVAGAPFSGLIPVIDIAAQAEISTFSLGANPSSVDVCSDNSVLVTSFMKFESNKVRRLLLSNSGTLTDTGEVLLANEGAENVYCAPGAHLGVLFRLT